MPSLQTAVTANFDFGAPVPAAGATADDKEVLRFEIEEGGQFEVDILNETDAEDGLHSGIFTLQTSPDGTTWAAKTVLSAKTVKQGTFKHYSVMMHNELDNYARLLAEGTVGGIRGIMQIRSRLKYTPLSF